MTARPRRSGGGWQRFWFAPESTATLALVRIAFGLLATLWLASLGPMLLAFFGTDAVLVERPRLAPWTWTFMTFLAGQPVLVVLFWLVSLLGAVALTVGWRTRLAAVVVLVGLVSFTRQMPLAINGGDLLIRVVAVYLVLAPAGAALSVDRWREHRDRFWSFPMHAPWVLRLMQIQLSVVYVSTVWEKVAGATWRNGTALSYALRLDDLQRLPTPAFVTDTVWLVQALTLGTLGLELAIGILVWNRAARPWVLGMGVLLHLSIDLTIAVGFFSFTMLTLYLAFLSPATSTRFVDAVRRRLEARRTARGGRSETDVPDGEEPAATAPRPVDDGTQHGPVAARASEDEQRVGSAPRARPGDSLQS